MGRRKRERTEGEARPLPVLPHVADNDLGPWLAMETPAGGSWGAVGEEDDFFKESLRSLELGPLHECDVYFLGL